MSNHFNHIIVHQPDHLGDSLNNFESLTKSNTQVYSKPLLPVSSIPQRLCDTSSLYDHESQQAELSPQLCKIDCGKSLSQKLTFYSREPSIQGCHRRTVSFSVHPGTRRRRSESSGVDSSDTDQTLNTETETEFSSSPNSSQISPRLSISSPVLSSGSSAQGFKPIGSASTVLSSQPIETHDVIFPGLPSRQGPTTQLSSVRFSRNSSNAIVPGRFILHLRVPKDCIPELLPVTNLEWSLLNRLRHECGEGISYCNVILRTAVIAKRRTRAIRIQRNLSTMEDGEQYHLALSQDTLSYSTMGLSTEFAEKASSLSALNSRAETGLNIGSDDQRKDFRIKSGSHSWTLSTFVNNVKRFWNRQSRSLSTGFKLQNSEPDAERNDSTSSDDKDEPEELLSAGSLHQSSPYRHHWVDSLTEKIDTNYHNTCLTSSNHGNLEISIKDRFIKDRFIKDRFMRLENRITVILKRLQRLHCVPIEIRGGGNCQFRSASYNLYGTQDYHEWVRHCTVCHISELEYRYEPFFEGDTLSKYLLEMSRPETCGDELTIRAISDAFQCTIHIVTSKASNWYLRYDPQNPSGQTLIPRRHLFFLYVAPVHYYPFCPILPPPTINE